eukprot:gene5233-8844_t
MKTLRTTRNVLSPIICKITKQHKMWKLKENYIRVNGRIHPTVVMQRGEKTYNKE